jgi:ribosomal subunit interface protein
MEVMMEIQIQAKNLTVSDRFRDYVAERSHKVEQLDQKVQTFSIKVIRHDHSKTSGPEDQVELTVHGGGHLVRAEAHAGDKFVAFDIAFGKLTERLRRAADKRKPHHGRHGSVGTSELTAEDFARLDVTPVDSDVLAGKVHRDESDDEPEFGHNPIVIRRKQFEDIKMSVDTALDRMELLGHDFFLFHDEATDKPSVVYKRKGWNYGVITLS